jgi:hypothetical protein
VVDVEGSEVVVVDTGAPDEGAGVDVVANDPESVVPERTVGAVVEEVSADAADGRQTTPNASDATAMTRARLQ